VKLGFGKRGKSNLNGEIFSIKRYLNKVTRRKPKVQLLTPKHKKPKDKLT
jgi:hypothetical protein